MKDRETNLWGGLAALIILILIVLVIKSNIDQHKKDRVQQAAKKESVTFVTPTLPVVPAVSVPLDTTPTSTNNGSVRVRFSPKMEIK